MPDPHVQDLVRELRRAVGLFDGAMAITPKQAWEEALEVVRNLRRGYCPVCYEKEYGRDWQTTAKGLAAESDQLRAALEQASRCCARPAGVCFDPALVDGGNKVSKEIPKVAAHIDGLDGAETMRPCGSSSPSSSSGASSGSPEDSSAAAGSFTGNTAGRTARNDGNEGDPRPTPCTGSES